MKGQASKKQLKPPAILTSHELPEDRSRNTNHTQILKNSTPTPMQMHSAQEPEKLRIRGKTDNKQKSSGAYNSLTTVELKSTSQIQQHGRTSFNTPLRGSVQKHPERVANSTSKLGNMTAVQLNQQQIEIEQQINHLSESFKAREEQTAKSEKIKVAVRVRPFVNKEVGKENVCYVSKNGKQIRVSDLTHTVEGTYDRVIPKEASQQEAYSFIQDCIPNLLQGFNCTIFAYGQTGSGKTFTMFGEGLDAQIRNAQPQMKTATTDMKLNDPSIDINSKNGIIPRSISELFNQIRTQNLKLTIYCSFLQIYNEKLYDLLQDTQTKNPLQIREEKFQGIYVEGLSEYVVQDELDCLNLLKRGEKNRIKRSTKMNIRSSRSHTLFQLLLEADKVDAKGMLKRAKLNLGDLAGSEKVNKEEEMKAKHMLELRNINLSLTTLGKVIQILAQGGGQAPHVPFRESKLTRLLQDSIGGNCQTYLIATVSPIMESIEETISTLKFADRAKCVMQRVKKNEINAKDDALIQRLQREVSHLKELLAMKRKGVSNPKDLSHQLYLLKDENERLRQMAMNYEDVERMKQENKEMRLELQRLKMLASDAGSNYNGDLSPRSFGGAAFHLKHKSNDAGSDSGALLNQKNNASTSSNQGAQRLSESDTESIQEGFKNYKSELNFEVKLAEPQKKPYHGKAAHQTEVQTHRDSGAQWVDSSPRDGVQGLKQQKERLHQVIQEQQATFTSPNKARQAIAIKKRFKEGDLSDEGPGLHRSSDVNLSLPAITDAQVSLQQQQQYSKVEFTRKSSNQDMYRLNISHQTSVASNQVAQHHQSSSPYSLNRSSMNPMLRSSETYLSDVQKPTIAKYPNRNASSIRRSLHEFPQHPQPSVHQSQNLVSISSEVNRSYQLGSQGMVGMTTQSSLYGMPSQSTFDKDTQFRNKSPTQTVVRIRGRYNQITETKGSVLMTLDEEKRIKEKEKQLRRSNERLRMLETMERARQEKVERELETLMAEKARREQEDQRKREIIKQRKYVNANVGILGDSMNNNTSTIGQRKPSVNTLQQ